VNHLHEDNNIGKKKKKPIFTDEFDEENLVFEHLPLQMDQSDDEDSSGAYSKQSRKSHLELLLQKANSISGIRKMNM
jgi:hypothetical protein